MIDLHVANLQEVRTEIALTDLNGKTWYQDYVKGEEGFATRLNLEGMPDGTYVLYIRNKNADYMQAIGIEEATVLFFQAFAENVNQGVSPVKASITNSPKGNLITYVTLPEAETIGVQLANLNKKELSVQLNNLTGTPICLDQIRGEYGYAKKFRLSGLDSDVYYLVMETAGIIQIQFFELKKEGVVTGALQYLETNKKASELVLQN